VPASFRDRLASWDGTAAPTRDAATIALLRPGGAGGPETYLLRRQPTMAFAPGMYVFPGGRLQESDFEVVAWAGPTSSQWGDRLGCDPDTARALVVAAVRETFEESGILFAGTDDGSVVADTSSPALQKARLDLDAGELSFGDFLGAHDLVLRSDLLGAWSHWITPAFEPRRYDTRFFVAAVPRGQSVGTLPGEADRATWASVASVLAAVEQGEAAMLPPTWITCRELLRADPRTVVDDAVVREIRPIEPQLVQVDGEWFLDNPIEEETHG
jgi:8-oxo-dGTP pyrophosphatase MutT (NUDIX family)